jgi:protein TonB
VPVPVDKTLDDFADDIPANVPIAQGSDSSGRVGAIAGPKTGGQVVQVPEVEPLPSEWVEELPDPVTRVKPDYPDIARNAGMEGTVLVRALVGLDGRVRRAEIERSSVMFDEPALAAVRQWTFTPAKSNGKAVLAWVRIPVKFTLH